MPSNTQISQLVLQVDANIAVAQRSLQDLAKTVQQSTGQMNTSLAANDAAIGRTLTQHHSLGLAYNNARIAQTELTAAVTRSVDAYGAGASPLRILSTEMGRLTEAAGFLGGGAGNGVLGSMVRFIGGPWGIAILLGVSILAKLITTHKEAGDSVDALVQKMRHHAEEARNSKLADEEWSKSLDGLIDRNEKLVDALRKRLQIESAVDLASLQQAQQDNKTAVEAERQAQAVVDNLKAQIRAQANQNSFGASGGPAGGAILEGLEQQLTTAESHLQTAKQAVQDTTTAITEGEIAVGQAQGKAIADLGTAAKRWSDLYTSALETVERANPKLAASAAAITAAFETLNKAMGEAGSAGESRKGEGKSTGGIAAAMDAASQKAKDLGIALRDGKITAGSYATEMQKLASSLTNVANAAKEAKKGTGEFGKQISFADAEAIAKGAGLTVTSGFRSEAKQAQLYRTVRTAENPVARPGTSAHEGVNGKWALDIAFAPGLTPQSIRKLYGDQGVSLSAIYKESGHYHIEGSRSQAAGEENAAARAAKEAARAAQKQRTDDDQFARESAQLDAETLAARKQLVAGFDTQAGLASDEVEAQRVATQAAIQKQLDAKQITKQQAEFLGLQADDLAAAKQAVIAHNEYVAALKQAAEAADQAFGFQIDDLKFADDMARTQAEHRKLQLDILDIQYQQKEANLQRLLLTIKANKDFATSVDLQNQAALVQAQINRLPTQSAEDQARVRNGTLDPLQAWAKQVPHTAADINQALQSIEVQGLNNLASGIADVINGTKTLGQVFKGISSEIIGEIVQMIVKMLVFRAISGIIGASVPAPNIGADAGVSLTTSSLVPSVGFRAAGGPVNSGAPYVVGENGPELFIPNASGVIVPSASRISRMPAANNNAGGPVLVELRLNDDMLDARIVQGAGQVVIATAPSLVKQSRDSALKSIHRQPIGG